MRIFIGKSTDFRKNTDESRRIICRNPGLSGIAANSIGGVQQACARKAWPTITIETGRFDHRGVTICVILPHNDKGNF